MTNYTSYTVEELATDELFRLWVLEPTPEISSFWGQWITDNPQKKETASQARQLVLAAHDLYHLEIPEDRVFLETQEIARLAEARRNLPETRLIQILANPALRVAAAFIVVMGLSWLYYTHQLSKTKRELMAVLPRKQTAMLVKVNTTDRDMTILLSDKSIATLTSGSRLSYPAHFTRKERNVYLEGEAFFDVSSNPDQPFVVFAHETVTKVLGTRFRIKAYSADKTEMIVVKTGRVSVYRKRDYAARTKHNSQLPGIVLNPNQQAVFIRKLHRLEKGTVADKQLLSESAAQKDQVFDDKPVPEVLHTMESLYGIVIIFNADSLALCRINAQFSDESLKQRLNAICQAIGATYEMLDGKVVINSKGCN